MAIRACTDMFQSFESKTNPASSIKIIAALRKVMKRENIDWFLVPHADEHQNEYLPTRAERLAFLTGFTGSAGYAMVGLEKAYIFVDGRYTVQAASQVDQEVFAIKDLISQSPSQFAETIVRSSQVIGYDAWLMTIGQKKTWQNQAKKLGAKLKSISNLIDEVWVDQPGSPNGKAWLHPVQYAGCSVPEKLQRLREVLREDGADMLLLTDPASLAWAFNLRGSDLIHNPLALGWVIIPTDAATKPIIFINLNKLSDTDQSELAKTAELLSVEDLGKTISALSKDKSVHCDPALVASHLGEMIEKSGGKLIEKRDPVILLRAVKNDIELEGARNAHIRDGVAMVRFLAWLDAQPHGSVTEISAAQQLEKMRFDTAKDMGSNLREISFDTISGAGAHGAIVHYRVTQDTNAVLQADTLYLVDSGGQYLDGTTDITRTIAIGTPPQSAVDDNTLVLKGHIAIATARFPKGTRGVDIDGLARMPLWQNGKDYAHGTGHGIGSYLNVHEGPQSISKRAMEPFLPGMIVSNEPGYYKEGQYGIRIENLVIVSEEPVVSGGDHPMLGFETITLCPIDLRLINKTLLNETEIDWLNVYHTRVYKTLAPHLSQSDEAWLKQATKPL
ncbi:MAG: aminopeptidase P family protein [Salaquimonas sp.]